MPVQFTCRRMGSTTCLKIQEWQKVRLILGKLKDDCVSGSLIAVLARCRSAQRWRAMSCTRTLLYLLQQ